VAVYLLVARVVPLVDLCEISFPRSEKISMVSELRMTRIIEEKRTFFCMLCSGCVVAYWLWLCTGIYHLATSVG
jgi:hypothetical protein